jgi:hypothetical protein
MNEGAYAWINHRDYGLPVNLIKPQKAYLSAFPAPLDADTCTAQIYCSDRGPASANATAPSSPYRSCFRSHTKRPWPQTRRSLLRCSGWIQCLIRCATIHVSKTWRTRTVNPTRFSLAAKGVYPLWRAFPETGYRLCVKIGTAVAACLSSLRQVAWVTNTTDQRTRVRRRHRIDSSASVASHAIIIVADSLWAKEGRDMGGICH